LSDANQALQEADRRKDEFLAMLAHELRNPLAPIRYGLHILRMPNADPTENAPVIELMEQQVHNLAHLVDDLLDVSRITRGKIQLQQDSVDLVAAVKRALESIRPAVDAQKLGLDLSLPQHPIYVQADSIRLEQVFFNLLSNAAKFTEPGGRIELTATLHEDRVAVRIRDTGIGIPSEVLPHIFELFVQSERGLDRARGGLGIGLTLVKKLIEMMGGNVTAYSAGAGQGSEFVVRLPIQEKVSHPHPVPASNSPPNASPPLRILVAEDLEAVAETASRMLKLWGHTVRLIRDGPSVLPAVCDFKPDVVLLDIGLPGMDGYEVARQINQEVAMDARPMIVAVTGYGQEEDRRRSREAGCDFHLVKPIDPSELRVLLESVESRLVAPGSGAT
jgi:two-component system CheB/CheR fusion protein